MRRILKWVTKRRQKGRSEHAHGSLAILYNIRQQITKEFPKTVPVFPTPPNEMRWSSGREGGGDWFLTWRRLAEARVGRKAEGESWEEMVSWPS